MLLNVTIQVTGLGTTDQTEQRATMYTVVHIRINHDTKSNLCHRSVRSTDHPARSVHSAVRSACCVRSAVDGMCLLRTIDVYVGYK